MLPGWIDWWWVSDKIMVLKTGKLIEYNNAESVFNNPTDEYTKNLITSVI